MESTAKSSSVSLVALCCAGVMTCVVAFDPTPAGYVAPRHVQSAVLLSVAVAEPDVTMDVPLAESSLIPQ